MEHLGTSFEKKTAVRLECLFHVLCTHALSRHKEPEFWRQLPKGFSQCILRPSCEKASESLGLVWMVVFGSRKRRDRWHMITPPNKGNDYKWYISGMELLPIGGWTMPPTTFYGNQKQPLIVGGFNPIEKYESNWIISPRFGVNDQTTT